MLEYLVPSTGKLYHHKMKLRAATGDSDPNELLSYLEKRHPLYFHQRKLSKPQVLNLVKKIVFKLGQLKPKAPAAATKPSATSPAASSAKPGGSDIFTQNKRQHLRDLEGKAREKENQLSGAKPDAAGGNQSSLAGAPSFKTGSQLPQLTDDLPPLGGLEKKKPTSLKFND